MADDKKGMTLWELARQSFQKKQEEPPEFKIFNPLKAKLDDFVAIEAADVSGTNFTVSEIDPYKRVRHGETFESVDYVLRDGDRWVYLRVNPVADADKFSQKHYDVLLLFPDYQMDYDKELIDNILNAGLPLEVRDDKGEVMATYTRLVEGMKRPDSCEVTVLKDRTKPSTTEIVYSWDFGRNLENGSCEFYFVELNETQGNIIQMLRGVEISEKDVTILPAN